MNKLNKVNKLVELDKLKIEPGEQHSTSWQVEQTIDDDNHIKAAIKPRKDVESTIKEKTEIVEATKVTELVDGSHACETKTLLNH